MKKWMQQAAKTAFGEDVEFISYKILKLLSELDEEGHSSEAIAIAMAERTASAIIAFSHEDKALKRLKRHLTKAFIFLREEEEQAMQEGYGPL